MQAAGAEDLSLDKTGKGEVKFNKINKGQGTFKWLK